MQNITIDEILALARRTPDAEAPAPNADDVEAERVARLLAAARGITREEAREVIAGKRAAVLADRDKRREDARAAQGADK